WPTSAQQAEPERDRRIDSDQAFSTCCRSVFLGSGGLRMPAAKTKVVRRRLLPTRGGSFERSASSASAPPSAKLHYGTRRDGCSDGGDGRFSGRRYPGSWQLLPEVAHSARANGSQVAETSIRNSRRVGASGALYPCASVLDRRAIPCHDRYS